MGLLHLSFRTLFLAGILLAHNLTAQLVQVTGSNFQSLPATTCTNTFINVNLQLGCANMVHNGNNVNVSGSTITIDVDYTIGPICLPAIVQATQNVNLGMLAVGSYTVVINGLTNGVGGSTINTSLTVNSCCSAVPSFTSSRDTVCVGDSVYFTNTSVGATSQTWYENNAGAITSMNYGKRYNTPGTYAIKLVVSNPTCSDSLTKSVYVSSPPVVDLGNDTTLCAGSTMVLNAGSGLDSVRWFDNSGAQTRTISSGGTYFVKAYKNTCESSDTIVIIQVAVVPPDLGNDTVICINDTLVLDAFLQGATYSWQDASSQSNYMVTTAGVYWVTVTDSNGCSSSDTLTVTPDSCYAGIGERQEAVFSVYPNPVIDRLHIVPADPYHQVHIQIRSAAGQTVGSFRFGHSKELVLELNYPAGLYQLEIETEDGRREVLPLIIE